MPIGSRPIGPRFNPSHIALTLALALALVALYRPITFRFSATGVFQRIILCMKFVIKLWLKILRDFCTFAHIISQFLAKFIPQFRMPLWQAYQQISYILNGPAICGIFVLGIFLNAFSILILLKSKEYKKLKLNRAAYQYKSSLERRLNESIRRKNEQIRKKPRIYSYLFWLIGCDIALLTFSFLNFSIPRLFDCLAGHYARIIPLW